MKCPVCGDELPENKSKCYRCGYECHDVVLSEAADGGDSADGGEEYDEFKEIDPDDVRMGHGVHSGGGLFDELFGGGIFGGSMFGGGLFGSMIDSIFSDVFSVNVGFGGEEYTDGYGDEYAGGEEDDSPEIVEVKNIEHLDEDGNVIGKKRKKDSDGKSGKKGKDGK